MCGTPYLVMSEEIQGSNKKTSRLSASAFIIFFLGIAMLLIALYSSTCTGSDPCNACKNSRYCKHCAKVCR